MANIFSEFIQFNGLYDKISISQDNINDLIELIGGNIKIESFCTCCKTNRVFQMKPIVTRTIFQDGKEYKNRLAEDLIHVQNLIRMDNPPKSLKGKVREWNWTERTLEEYTRVIVFPFYCSMNQNHRLDFIVKTEGTIMEKIGQSPSVADLSFPEIEQYKNVIDSEYLSELKTAIGLYSHGVGAGSYVYLRRIFEQIIDIAKNKAIEEGKIVENDFNQARMIEKIKMLKGYIPEIVSDNTQLYGIVSKGIHELSEEECLQYFPVLKSCILLILQQWKKLQEENKMLEDIHKSLNKINTNIS